MNVLTGGMFHTIVAEQRPLRGGAWAASQSQGRVDGPGYYTNRQNQCLSIQPRHGRPPCRPSTSLCRCADEDVDGRGEPRPDRGTHAGAASTTRGVTNT